jgi:hypothetical protein
MPNIRSKTGPTPKPDGDRISRRSMMCVKLDDDIRNRFVDKCWENRTTINALLLQLINEYLERENGSLQ